MSVTYPAISEGDLALMALHIERHGENISFGPSFKSDAMRLLTTVAFWKSKYDFEHALANDLQMEVERLDEEIDSLRRELEDDGTPADRTSYLGPPVPTKTDPRSWAEEVQEEAADFYGREHAMGDS